MGSGTARTPAMLGVALLPADFPDRLNAVKELSGMSWERMAAAMGVDSRQLHRWRQGTVPGGEGMFSLVRFATHVPGGLAALLGEDASAEYQRNGG